MTRNRPKTPDALAPGRVVPLMELYPHQVMAVDSITAALCDGGRAIAAMACGTGKTHVARFAYVRLGASVAAFFCPTIALIDQTWRRFREMGMREPGMAVCSDDTAVGADPDAADMMVAEADFPLVTTDPAEVAAFLFETGPRTVFCTYASAGVLAEAALGAGITFDMATFDEAHHLAGHRDARRDALIVPARRRLSLTATPRVFRAKDDAVSMDDPSVFGETCHRYTFAEAIRDRQLCDYKLAVIGVPRGEDRATIGRNEDALRVAVAKAVIGMDLRSVLTFHSRVKRARDFADKFAATCAGLAPSERAFQTPVRTGLIHGEMPQSERRAVLSILADRDAHNVVCSAQALREGVDVPAVDGVVMMDPSASVERVTQAFGRGLRTSPGKVDATFVLPIPVGEGESPAEVIASGRYAQVLTVMRALRSMDERFESKLRAVCEGEGQGEARTPGPEIIFDVPPELLAAMRVRLVRDSSLAPWEETFAGVKSRWPDRLTAEDLEWVKGARSRFNQFGMPSDRQAAFESLSGWSWSDPRPARVQAKIAAIRPRWPDALTRRDRDYLNSRRALRGTNPDADQALESWPGWWWDAHAPAVARARDVMSRWPDRLSKEDWQYLNERRGQAKKGIASEAINAALDEASGGRWREARPIMRARDVASRWPDRLTKDDVKYLAERRTLYRRGCRNAGIQAVLEPLPGWSWDYRDGYETRRNRWASA